MLVDDHPLFRSGMRSLIDREPDLEVVAEAEDGEAAIALTAEFTPDLILMDIHMPGFGGLQATRAIKAQWPAMRILMLSATEEDDWIFDAMTAGAEGYLVKALEPEEFMRQVRAHVRGENVLPGDMAVKVLRICSERAQESASVSPLTERELEVLRLVGQGCTNRDIAGSLYIAENTVKNHLRNILQKLHCANRVQAAAYAVRAGLVTHERRH